GRPGAPAGRRGQRQGPPTPAGAGAGAFGGQAPGAPQGLRAAGGPGGPEQDLFGGRAAVPPQRGSGADQGRPPQLPPRGGPRAELPGGNPQPRTPSWGDENAPPLSRASLDAPRGHDEQDDAAQTSRMPRFEDREGPGSTAEIPAIPAADAPQGPGATGELPRRNFTGVNGSQNTGPLARSGFDGFDAPQNGGRSARPGGPGQQGSGQFVRSDVFGAPTGRQDAPATGRFAAQQPYDGGPAGRFDTPGADNDGGSTGQFGTPNHDNGSTGQFPTPNHDGASTGQFRTPDYDGASTGQFPAPVRDNGSTGQFPAPGYDNGSTGQHALPVRQSQQHTGQFERPQTDGRGTDFSGQRPPAPPRRAPRQEPEALPPASGPGDGRTPLYDNLETNWFHGGPQERQQGDGSAPAGPGPQGGPAPATGPQRPVTSSWRSSPNDELVRQAERVRQPAAGGVTTSGLPRRVPRANLVPGTAQQQQHQSGPQVSRAPDDVRGRLTNLRRGIAQGRQANNGQGDSFPSPTHQQER
ncbi:nitrate- and nitrite sensing domain-containing protein, partial [Streptomyces sp. NPDC004752]